MNFFQRNRNLVVLVISVILLVIAFITSGYRMRPNALDLVVGGALIPVQRTFTGFADWLFALPQYFRDIEELTEENDRLRAQLAQTLAENNRLNQIAREAEGLAELLGVRSRYPDHPMLGAQVVAAVSGNWFDSFTIDRGSADGVERNMPVLAHGGLVGRVVLVGRNYSRVVSFLNIDEGSAVSVRTVRTEEFGVVRGDITLKPNGLARMDYIDLDAAVAAGDELVTSNLGEIFPPGISVGSVQEVRMDASGLFNYAIVSPSVDFSNINMVFVITDTFGGHLRDNLE